MKLVGVIGDPISHSLSPRMHRYWLGQTKVVGDYVPLPVKTENLSEVLCALPKMGFYGVNITIPHKISVLMIADEVTERASAIGAANTLTFRPDGSIHADNTDGIGFIENLRNNAPKWKPTETSALILGAGGASRAVISALLDAGTPEITLANRTKEKAEALQAIFGDKVRVQDWENFDVSRHGLIVNTTSLGMTGQPQLEISLEKLQPDTIVNDLVYNPIETPLLASAKQAGCFTIDGLGMLIHQGIPGFERWFGVRPEVTDELRKLLLS